MATISKQQAMEDRAREHEQAYLWARAYRDAMEGRDMDAMTAFNSHDGWHILLAYVGDADGGYVIDRYEYPGQSDSYTIARWTDKPSDYAPLPLREAHDRLREQINRNR